MATTLERMEAVAPTTSILTSAYGNETDLAEMIESVRAQTRADWELVVVDNRTGDAVAAVLAGYAEDPRIRVVHTPYRGLGPNVDAAAGAARGRYYAVVHGDDLLVPSFCERTTAILDADPSIDAVVVDAYPFADGVDRPESFRQLAGVTDEPGIGHRMTLAEVVGGSVLYYTAAIRAAAWQVGVGYTCDTPKVEDLQMFLRMLAAGCDIRVLPEQLARYRLHADTAHGLRDDQDEYEDSVERAYQRVTELTEDPAALAALDRTLRTVRYERAMRRSREALLASDTTRALDQARIALGQRKALRPVVICAALTLAPGLLRRVHPAKQQISGLIRRARGAVRSG